MTLERRIRRIEERSPNPNARGPRFPVLWEEEEEVPADLPEGSRVARVVWGRPDATEEQQDP